ncbi:hypothetical protein SPHV1_910004 [Novosphingobium sp. KN65.2]|nr:hypothetical protein SPHV1_910004 [Novosphingobium sp. KN65.2]
MPRAGHIVGEACAGAWRQRQPTAQMGQELSAAAEYERAAERGAVAGSVGVYPGGDVPGARGATHWWDREPACGIGTVSAAASVAAKWCIADAGGV